MRTIKSVIIVTNAGQVEGVFTSFRALSQSNGVSHINIEGVYETYTETELKDIFCNGQTLPILWNEMQNNGNASKSVNYEKDRKIRSIQV